MKTLTCFALFALWGTATQTVNFDSAKPGALPPEWTVTPDSGEALNWRVVEDSSAPSPPHVLAQTSHHSDSHGPCPLAILNKTNVKDGDLSVKVKPVAGKHNRAGGLVFRYRDPDHYYLLREDPSDNNIMLYKVEEGKRIPLASKGALPVSFGVKHPVPPNEWSVLKVQFRGPLFSVYFNHRRLFEVLDSSFPQSGKVGLWTNADGVTYFDDFRIAAK